MLEGGRECYRAEGPSACAQGAQRRCLVHMVRLRKVFCSDLIKVVVERPVCCAVARS